MHAEAAYGSGRPLGQGMEPHVPVLDRRKQIQGMLTRAEFRFDRGRDVYVSPRATT